MHVYLIILQLLTSVDSQLNGLPRRCRRFWHATHNCVAPYVDIILHRGRFWAKSAASGSVRWCCFRSCWMVLSHVMRGRPSCLLQSAGAEANRILQTTLIEDYDRSVSASRHFLLQARQYPCSVRKRFSRDHCCRGKSKPGCRIVGSHAGWELTA